MLFFLAPAAITSKFESTEKLINTEYVLECAASGRPIPKVSIHHLEKELIVSFVIHYKSICCVL